MALFPVAIIRFDHLVDVNAVGSADDLFAHGKFDTNQLRVRDRTDNAGSGHKGQCKCPKNDSGC